MTADDKAAVRSPAGAGSPAPPVSELKVLGKYQIEKKIGAGGMGAVFLARDTELKRTVALKVLPKDKAQNPTLVRRFRAEAQAAAQLRHPNIVAVFDSGEADGHLYIAMEYVEGKDLFELVARRGVVPVRRSIDIIKQVASALQHAYEQNIVHRDIKPSNLLIRRDGVVKLTDLGLARSIDDTLETNITRAGTTVGTVDYMSPEQARNSKLADIRSDLYSLGCTWYQMLTGQAPYPDGSVTNKLQAHAIKPIPDPREKNSQIPEGLTAVIRRMMAKKPEDRYQTPAELIDELNHATLTHAAISREIFADDDEEVGTGPIEEEEGFSDDSYFEMTDTRRAQATPDRVVSSEAPTRRKPLPPKESADTGHTTSRTRSSPARETEAEEEPEPVVGRRFKPIPAKPHAEPEPGPHSDRTAQPEADEDAHHEGYVRKSKSKSTKPDANEPSSKSTSKPADAKPTADPKTTKPKAAGQKQLPPKMQPVEGQEEGEKQGPNLDRLRYFAAVGGLLLIIVGAGWLISRFGNNVDIAQNPFGPEQNPGTSTTNVPNIPGKTTAGNSGENTDSNTITVANAGNANSTKPEATQVFDVEKVPDWVAAQLADPLGLPNFTVSPAAKSATNFPTIEEALQAVPADGAVITLRGSGPFPLSPVNLAKRKRILLTTTTPQDRPVIILKPGDDPAITGLTLNEGLLELRGLHFIIERQAFPGSMQAIQVMDGQLVVSQCSFTATGNFTNSAIAMSVESTTDSTSVPGIEPRLLVDRVLVRGDGLTGLSIHRANVDAVVRDSLMVTGSAPAIDIGGHLTAAADVPTTKPRRIVRIQRCTLSAQKQVCELSVDPAGKPPETAIALRDCLCAAQGVVQNSAIVTAARWPKVKTNEGWLPKLTWTSTNTLYLGFEQLVDLEESFKVLDVAAWQRIWNAKKVDPRQFQKLTFPETTLEELSVVQPHDFDSGGLSYRDLKSTDGGLPGCVVTKLLVPDVSSQQRATAMALRPSLPPAAVKTAEPSQVRKVDLKKEDLGVILNRADWPNGTMFEATGGGLCTMTPARIEGKSLRIVFRQTDGTNLKVQPLQPKAPETVKTMPPALISITNGTLELTNVVLEGSPNSKAVTPEWLVQSTNATVILDGCRLLGSEADGSKQLGLVQWNTSLPVQAKAEAPALVIRDSYLTGFGCGIRTQCGQGAVIFRNTILAIRGDALDLRPARAGNALLSVVDAENVTFSATGAAVRFEAAPGTEAVTSPVRVFMEKCVYAPPLAFKAGESARATLLNCVGPVLEQKQLEWWGASNGVAKQVVHLVRQDDDQGGPSDERTGLSAWRKTWDKANSVRFLSGDKGVYLVGELPVRWRELKPASFELHKGSQAATWGDGGKPIGASPRAIEDSSLAKKDDKPKVNPAGTNKKNVGF